MNTKNLQIKDGKIKSKIRNKWLVCTPEEMVRQSYIHSLLNKYKYQIEQIGEEVTVTGRGSGGARADFVIWKSVEDRKKKLSPFIIIECKADNVTIKGEDYFQGERYARIANAPFFVTHNNHETRFWRVKKDKMPGYIEEIEDIPKANSTEKEIKELLNRLKVFKENEFADLLHSCHNIIRNREKLDPAAAFDEIAKILFMKVYAERRLKKDLKGNIFTLDYIEQGERFNPDYLQDIFSKTKRDFGRDKLFNIQEKINLRASTIKSIIGKLEKYNLSATSTDVKGIAFEKFLGRTFRGEIGQFFTPRRVVEFMIDMLSPKEGDVVCDPASGSGGFLIKFFENVREQIHKSIDDEYQKEKKKIDNQENLSEEEKAKLKTDFFNKLSKEIDPSKKNSRMWKLANRCVYGVDANERMARTSKMNMIMHGDGHGGIHHHDGFLNVNGIFEERFDIILTNPPFGQNVEKEDEVLQSQIETDDETIEYYGKIYGDSYINSQENITNNVGKSVLSLFDLPKSKSIKTELLFIERCLSLLKPGGKLGIVLPEGVFNTSNAEYVRIFSEDRAFIDSIVSLPQSTFESTGTRVKASLLFLTKFTQEEKEKWDNELENAINEEREKFKVDLETLNKEIKESKGKEKTNNKKRLKELEQEIISNGRCKAKEKWNHKIFMYEAINVGIDAQGDDTVDNELPNVLIEYKKFKSNQTKYSVPSKLDTQLYIPKLGLLTKWTVPIKLLLDLPNPNNWDVIPLKKLVTKIEENEKVEKEKEYKMVGVKWYGEGAFYRETVKGDSISASYLYPLVPNSFIYNRLFAWKVSFAIVPESLRGYYVSNEFPQFVADKSKLLPEYLYFLFIQDEVIKAVKAASGGSAAVSRNRLKESEFLEFEFPIPPIDIQKKIVEKYLADKKKAEDFMKQAELLMSNAKQEVRDLIIGYKKKK